MRTAQTIVGLANCAGAAPSRPTPIRGHDAGIQRKLRIRALQACLLCQSMQIKVRQKPFLREIQRHGARQCRALLSRDAGSLVRAHVQAAGVLDLTLCQDALPESKKKCSEHAQLPARSSAIYMGPEQFCP